MNCDWFLFVGIVIEILHGLYKLCLRCFLSLVIVLAWCFASDAASLDDDAGDGAFQHGYGNQGDCKTHRSTAS